MFHQLSKTALKRIVWGATGVMAMSLSSCTSTPKTNEVDASAPTDTRLEDELQIVTTFLPITQFATAVAGDRAQIVQLLPANIDPHDYQARPSDIQAIANADVIIKNGLEMEFFLDDMIENAENADLALIDTSQGISTLESTEEHSHSHSHNEEAHDEEVHDEGSHDEENHGEENHGDADPHIWLDPKRAIKQVENIKDGLIAADPEGETVYTANAEAFITELTALDTEIAEVLSPFEGQTFVVLHDFAGYFADSYGLQFQALVELPEDNPSPEDIRRVIETVQSEGLSTILAEPQVEQASFETIANDLGASISTFNPMETGDSAATDPDNYIDNMRQNAENLAAGFESSS